MTRAIGFAVATRAAVLVAGFAAAVLVGYEVGPGRFRLSHNELWNLPGRLELASNASATGTSISPFILYYRAPTWSDAAVAGLETFSRGILAEIGPVGFDVTLPDGTTPQYSRKPATAATCASGVSACSRAAMSTAASAAASANVPVLSFFFFRSP